MSTVSEKMDKQFTYQRTAHATSGDLMDLFVSVDHLTKLIVAQTRGDEKTVRRQVKGLLELLADAGEVWRWIDVYGRSQRPDRDDHYFLIPGLAAEQRRTQCSG